MTHLQSPVATYWHNDVTCRKSHWKNLTTYTQADSPSKNRDKWYYIDSEKSAVSAVGLLSTNQIPGLEQLYKC